MKEVTREVTREVELEKVKELIKKYYTSADGGMFFTRNIVGDPMKTIFKGVYFTLDICRYWGYYELFGCTADEEKDIKRYYDSLAKEE